MDNYYVYIVKCVDDTLYIGTTRNVKRRVYQHNHSKSAVQYTKTRRPVELVYSEKVGDLDRALIRENEIKNLSKDKRQKLIDKE